MSPETDADQPELLPGLVRESARSARAKATATRERRAREVAPAETDPVARVLVDVPLAHLDRTFDYLVPTAMAEGAVPGARVKVRFAGQDVDGYVVERAAASEHEGRLAPLRRVVSAEPVLAPEIVELAGRLAERYAGSRADVIRLAVPPRHATAEKEPSPVEAPADVDLAAARSTWATLSHGAEFVDALAAGASPRAVWSAAPATDWTAQLAHAAAAAYSAGRGVLLCVPDRKDVARLDAALSDVLGEGHHVVLTADSGPAARYREFLALARGTRRIVVGTRAAAFAPVAELGLVAIWDDGDDLHAEPRAPYPHVREVLLTRAEIQGCAALVGGFARTVEADYLLRTGWARELQAPRDDVRRLVGIGVAGASDRDLDRDPLAHAARVPSQAHEAIRSGLESGPVLVQTPRAGYAASLACERCRTPARCAKCTGPLRLGGPADAPACAWCGTADESWACATCGHRGLRAPVVGEARTAEELGRAFPRTLVRTSGGERVLADVDEAPAIVVATPGAEPVAQGGYAVVVLLDSWLLLTRPDLRTREEALRRWLNAAALVRPGGRVLAVGDPGDPTLQALVRWDPAGHADRELADRQSARLPPASRLATITGAAGAVDDALTLLELPEAAELLGPAAVGEGEWRAVVRVPRSLGPSLSEALGELQRLRSARKLDPVRVQVDPVTL